jgi:uncharacterized protein (UPF0335 family)
MFREFYFMIAALRHICTHQNRRTQLNIVSRLSYSQIATKQVQSVILNSQLKERIHENDGTSDDSLAEKDQIISHNDDDLGYKSSDILLSRYQIGRLLSRGRNDRALEYVLNRVLPEQLRSNSVIRKRVEVAVFTFLRFGQLEDAQAIYNKLLKDTNPSAHLRAVMVAVDALQPLTKEEDDPVQYARLARRAHAEILVKLNPFLCDKTVDQVDLRNFLTVLEDLPSANAQLCISVSELYARLRGPNFKFDLKTSTSLARLKVKADAESAETETADLKDTIVAILSEAGVTAEEIEAATSDAASALADLGPAAGTVTTMSPHHLTHGVKLDRVEVITTYLNELHLGGKLDEEKLKAELQRIAELGLLVDTKLLNQLISNAVRNKQIRRAFLFYQTMLKHPSRSVIPNERTFGSLFNALDILANTRRGRKLLHHADKFPEIVMPRELFRHMLDVYKLVTSSKRNIRNHVI